MTLLLAPFWAFGKEKSTDQAETEKGEQEAPEWKLPICYVLDRDNQIVPMVVLREGQCWGNLFIPEGSNILPLNKKDDDAFVNHLNQLGILNRSKIESVETCVVGKNP